jgi:hypothetical protein
MEESGGHVDNSESRKCRNAPFSGGACHVPRSPFVINTQSDDGQQTTQCQHGPATRSGWLLIDGTRSLSISPFGSCIAPRPCAGSIMPIFERSALKKANGSAPKFRRLFSLYSTPSICPSFFPRPRHIRHIPSPLPSPPSHFNYPCNTPGANTMVQATLASRHTHILVSIISSRHSRSSNNIRASSNNMDQPLTQGLSHFPNHPLILFPPPSNNHNKQFIAHHVHRLHTRL